MMLDDDGVHPDEGTIHAWLDGALDARESARLDAHVAGCAECAARVAEARGLIAGASRVVGLLDDDPTPLLKPASTPTAETELSAWRLLRVTPARASIAAMLVVAVGIALTRGSLGVDSRTKSTRPMMAPGAQESAPLAGAAAPLRDSVLESAIRRRLETEQPPRTVAAVPGIAIPAPEPVAAASKTDFGGAGAKVLAGRASMRAQRETSGTRADRTRAGVGQLAVGAADAADRVTVAARAADSAGRSGLLARARGFVPGIAAGECYVVESGAPATWGSVRLPMIVAMDSSGTNARILTPSGEDTEARAYLQHNGADSALFRLRRIGFAGSMSLAAAGATRAGVIRSTASTMALSEVVTTSAGGEQGRPARDRSAGGASRQTAPAAAAPAPPRAEAGGSAIAVTARRVSCPAR